MTVDEESIVCALGSAGNLELWDRRTQTKQWCQFAHKDGAYTVDMNKEIVVSGGDDGELEDEETVGIVKIWRRSDGELIHQLEHHTYIVWCVRLWLNQLVTCSYDLSVALLRFHEENFCAEPDLLCQMEGPAEWSDAMSCDQRGRFLVTHNDDTFTLQVWDLCFDRTIEQSAATLTLTGHTDEVHSVKFLSPYVVSGSADCTVRLWDISTGECLRVLTGHEGKIWAVDIDRNRIVSGGRFGEIRVWSLADCLDPSNEDCSGRGLWVHARSTNVGQLKLERSLLISADGLGQVLQSDFWNLMESKCGCGAPIQ